MIIHAAGPYLLFTIILSAHHLTPTDDDAPDDPVSRNDNCDDNSDGVDNDSPTTELIKLFFVIILLSILRCLDSVLPPPPLLLDPFPLDDILNVSVKK